MIIRVLTVGAFQVNNYLVVCPETKKAAIIDAGGDYELTVATANEYEAQIEYVLNTHGHLDHIAGDFDLQTKTGAKVLMHKDDEVLANSLKEHLKLYGMPDYEVPRIDAFVVDGQEINVGNITFKVIHTPGHSKGSVCYLVKGILFSGDTLFADSVGRTDLPGGSYEELEQSIKKKLFTLEDTTIVYPGHGRATTIEEERLHNPYFGIEVAKR
jgi:hydroxyacylglutathione hydrolase